MSANITVDVSVFKQDIRRIARKSGKTVQKVMGQQMSFLANDLIDKTPPKGLTGMSGRKAVRRDMNLIFAHGNQELIDWLWLTFGRGNGKGNRVVFNSEGNANRMKGWHKRWRRARGKGPVRYNKQIVERYPNKGGTIEMSNQMYVPNDAYKSMLKTLEGHVGILKATWLPAVRKWKGHTPPGFVSRQKAHGSAHGKIDVKGSGKLVAISNSHYRPKNMIDLVQKAVKKRERDVSKWLEIRLKDEIDKENARAR